MNTTEFTYSDSLFQGNNPDNQYIQGSTHNGLIPLAWGEGVLHPIRDGHSHQSQSASEYDESRFYQFEPSGGYGGVRFV